jgi:hypothetical protein
MEIDAFIWKKIERGTCRFDRDKKLIVRKILFFNDCEKGEYPLTAPRDNYKIA